MSNIKEYLDLLEKTYDEAVIYLLEKYGPSEDHYFKEKSYQRFLNGEIKSIARGNYSRATDGLECHHIDENKFLNMTSTHYVARQKIPFKYHRKERLVFCDVVEHTILHVLIASETKHKFGYPGYTIYLSDKIKTWYLDKNIPQKSKWHITCYHKSYLTPEEAFKLLKIMNEILSNDEDMTFYRYFMLVDGYHKTFPNTLDDYYYLAEKAKKMEKLKEEFSNKEKERQLKMEKLKPEYIKQAEKINEYSSRNEIVEMMYKLNEIGAVGYNFIYNDFVYSDKYKRRIHQPVNMNEYSKRMEAYDLNGILNNIELYLKYEKKLIGRSLYFDKSRSHARTTEEIVLEKQEKEETRKLIALKSKKFYEKYPKFEQHNIKYDIMRQDINALLFKEHNKKCSFIEFQSIVKKYNREELLEKLHSKLASN